MEERSYNLPCTMYDLPFLCKRKLTEVYRKLNYCQVHATKAKVKLKLKPGTLRYKYTLFQKFWNFLFNSFTYHFPHITYNKERAFKSSYCYERNNQCFVPRQVPKSGIDGWRVSCWYPISLKVWVEPTWRNLATLPTKLEHLNDNIIR